MIPFLLSWLEAIWQMLLDSAGWLLIGLALAGLLRAVLNEATVRRFLDGGRLGSVVRAALIGVPMPLCSCSVLPVAHQLRKAGAGRGSTVSFLIATPESGVDSIALTYSMMGPLMAIARPVAAFLTAVLAGMIEAVLGRDQSAQPLPQATPSCGCDCGSEGGRQAQPGLSRRLVAGLKYAFTDLTADLAVYLLLGYLLAGLVSAVWSPETGGLPDVLRSGWSGYLGALVLGLPLYICATSSTPLAAALMASGFSPGAALVFLMVGPATNIASMAVVVRIIGTRALVRYLIVIVVVSLACGLAVDALALGALPGWLGIEGHPVPGQTGIVSALAAFALTTLIAVHSFRRLFR